MTPEQLDVDELFELVARGTREPAKGSTARGELVAPAAQPGETFADTLVASKQTSAPTSGRVCAWWRGCARRAGRRT
jgi:hypothetical protein